MKLNLKSYMSRWSNLAGVIALALLPFLILATAIYIADYYAKSLFISFEFSGYAIFIVLYLFGMASVVTSSTIVLFSAHKYIRLNMNLRGGALCVFVYVHATAVVTAAVIFSSHILREIWLIKGRDTDDFLMVVLMT
jgi:hypothetical protein